MTVSRPTLVRMYPHEPLVTVTCLGCGRRIRSDDPELIVDLGEISFKAYYHNLACFRQAKRVEEQANV